MWGNGKTHPNGRPLTYQHDREYIKGKLPPNAPTNKPRTEEQD